MYLSVRHHCLQQVITLAETVNAVVGDYFQFPFSVKGNAPASRLLSVTAPDGHTWPVEGQCCW